MGLKRQIAHIAERITGTRIVYPKDVPVLLEEEHLRRFFRRFEVDCVFDVGANAGQFALMLRKRASYEGPIISFEPNPDLAHGLRRRAQHDHSWLVEEIALGPAAGRATFHIMAEDQLSSFHKPQTNETKLFRDGAAVVREVNVSVSTLHIELPKYRRKLGFKRPFLKMDTQGHDLEIARGASDALQAFVGLQSEISFRRIYESTPTYHETISFYEGNGFVLSALVPNNAGFFPDLIEMNCIMYRSNGPW